MTQKIQSLDALLQILIVGCRAKIKHTAEKRAVEPAVCCCFALFLFLPFF
jgi:hypothetical protein